MWAIDLDSICEFKNSLQEEILNEIDRVKKREEVEREAFNVLDCIPFLNGAYVTRKEHNCSFDVKSLDKIGLECTENRNKPKQ